MRKLFAIILAIIFAFLVATSAMIWQKGIDFSGVNINTVKEIWKDIITIDVEEREEIKITDVNMPEPEQNLTYDERIEKGDFSRSLSRA